MGQKMSDDLTEQRSDGPKRTGLEQVRTPDILFGIAPEGITVKNQRRITMNRLRRRMLALLLTAVMVVTMLPAVALAGNVSNHIVINQAYGGGGNSGAEYKNDFVELYNPTDTDVDLTGWSIQYASKQGTSWSVTKLSGTIQAGGFFLIQEKAGAGGTEDLPTPDQSGSIAMSATEFKLALVNGDTAITGKEDATVVDFLGVGSNANEYEGTAPTPELSNTTAACRKTDGVDTDDNAADFSVVAPNPRNSASGAEPTPDPEPSEPVSSLVSISDALAGADGETFTVEGVVTLVDGKNIYVQDDTGGIDLFFGSAPRDIALGDTIICTGSRTSFKGLPELASATYEKSTGLTLSPKDMTIAELTTADICTYVRLSGVEVTEVYDNNGAYSSPNITVTDSQGNSIQIYKAVTTKTDGSWGIQVGDVVNVTAAVSVYNTTLQLRNTQASEIEKVRYAKLADSIADGDQFVIYYNAGGLVMNYTPDGNKLTGTAAAPQGDFVTVTGTMAVLTAAQNTDNYYTFTNEEGQYLTTGPTGNSLTFEDDASDYSLWTLKAVTGGWHIVSVKAVYNGSAQAMEVYKGLFTTFSEKDTDYYRFNLYELTDEGPSGGALPAAGDQVVLYNHSSQGVLAGQDDNTGSPSITGAAAELTDGKAAAANGGRVFTVEKNGDYYRFKTAHDGYLCSNGTGNNAFYQQEATQDADWTLAEYNGGFTLESRTAKFNGKYSQYLEYYAGAYKTYSMHNVTDKDIYTFQFYPVADGVKVTDGVVNLPQVVFGTLPDAYVGQAYTFTFTVDAVFGVSEAGLTVKAGETILTANGDGTYTIPVDAVNGESITITVTGQDAKGTAISGTASVAVKDEPVIGAVTPAAGAETGAEKRPVISAEFSNGGEAPVAVLTLKSSGTALDEAVMTVDGGKAVYIPETDLTDGRYTATVTVTRADGKSSGKTWSFTVGQSTERLYFGQLHSHTQYSDGSGTLESALSYVANLPDSANVDFVAFTDHSNYFDKSGAANPEGALYDMSQATAYSQETWNSYKTAIDAFNAENNGKIALGGFEMTWSGGPGHINTFNTAGIVSRNNTALNNKTDDAGLKAYYALLSQPEGVDSLSQFNHPGSTFGTFSDFSYWDALIDSRMYMVEVGNGEGAIGAGGYYPSYEYYTMALDKGWHVAPTNNQDNHKGKWGNANDARDVILTDDFSEQGIYEAIRSHRMYATEDKNLEIYYTVNEQPLGSILEEIPEELSLSVQVSDPDRTDSISKVEVIVNSGRVAYAWDDPAELASGLLSCTLDPTYSYYYIRVTEGDGDMAVTAPVWVGETLKLGISSVVCGTSTPVTDEELTITTTLFNSESADAAVKSVTYTSGGETLGVDAAGYTVPASGALEIPFRYTPTVAKVMTITVTVLMEQKGVEYEYAMDVTLDVLDSAKLVYIGIDASHYNEYVAGNYKDSMGNFGNLAAGYGVRTVELKSSEELIAACANEKYKALIFTAPSRRLADAQSDPRTYSPAELAAVSAFHEAGGMVILAGWSDNYENYDVIQGNPDIKHMAATQNELLAALGSSLRISDDATYDDVRSAADGVDKWRLYFSSYNWENLLTENVEFDANHPFDRMYTQVFSHYGGASIYAVDASGNPIDTLPETVSPVVFGHATTYSVDVDKDGLGGDSTPKYAYAENDDRLLVMASERQPDRGMVIVSGAAFMSNFEVQATIEDSGSEKNYANYTICENLVQYLNPTSITPIADVQAAESEGVKFTIEGVVTSNASGYDKDTAFFDCIYVQDDTAGINAFPVAGDYKVGDRVRITGTTSSYQGERQIAVTSIKAVGEGNVEPKTITAGQLNDGSVLGSLVTISGTVASFEKANGLVQTIMVRDKNGELARVFIDGYITTGQDVQNLRVGRKITATGLASYDNTFNAPDGPFPRIRIRDRADVVCKRPSSGSSSAGQTIPDPDVPLEPEPDEKLPFLDVDEDAWYYDAVCYVYGAGLFQGTSGTTFGPDDTMTRSMTATVLYRLSGETYTGTAATFGDMAAGAWYGTGVSWAAAREIAKGYGDGRFGVNDPVTREQLAAILYRYARYKGEDVSVGEDTNLIGFKDAGQVSEWAAPAVRWAVGVGLLKGDAAGCLRPLDQAARSEFAALLWRYVEREQT